MRDNKERDQWEERIIEASNQINNIQLDWFNGAEWDLFVSAWYDLVTYYDAHEDTVIGIEVVREYADVMRLLGRIIYDEKLSMEVRAQVEDKMTELES